MKELLLYMAKNLVDNPDSVSVTEIEGETTFLLRDFSRALKGTNKLDDLSNCV